MIDVAKGGGIIGVVLAHAVQGMVVPGGGGNNAAVQFFYSFLYMFFFISGYLYRPGRSPKDNIIKLSKRIIPVFILCTVVLTLIMWIYLSILGYNIPFEDAVDTLVKSLIGKKTFMPIDSQEVITYGGLCDISFSFYYIVFFYAASVIFYLFIDKTFDDLKNTVVAVAILLILEFVLLSALPVHLPYCIEGCLVPAALMFIGSYASRKSMLTKIDTEFLRPKRIALFLIMLIVGILSCIYIPLTLGLSSARFGTFGALSVFTCLITVLSCGYVLFTLFALLGRIPILSAVLAYCGKHSLSILMLHAFFMKIIVAPYRQLPETSVIVPIQTIPEAVIVSTASIVLCLLTSYILDKTLSKIISSGSDRPTAV